MEKMAQIDFLYDQPQTGLKSCVYVVYFASNFRVICIEDGVFKVKCQVEGESMCGASRPVSEGFRL